MITTVRLLFRGLADGLDANACGGSYGNAAERCHSNSSFTGQSFSLIYKGGITFSKFDVYVDEVLVGTLDQKLEAATYQVRWDYPGQLAAGTISPNWSSK